MFLIPRDVFSDGSQCCRTARRRRSTTPLRVTSMLARTTLCRSWPRPSWVRSSGWRETTSAVTAELPVSDLERERKEEVEKERGGGGAVLNQLTGRTKWKLVVKELCYKDWICIDCSVWTSLVDWQDNNSMPTFVLLLSIIIIIIIIIIN